jgi:hypothetical protein
MKEPDEIASSMKAPIFATFSEAVSWLKQMHPDWEELWGYVQTDNIASALVDWSSLKLGDLP